MRISDWSSDVCSSDLDELKLACFCKTSGATGLHIYVPLNGRYDFEVTRATAQFIAQRAHERVPSITSLERSLSKRQKKAYRSEERRVGKEWVSTCRSGWSPSH